MPDWDQRYRRGKPAPKEPTPLLRNAIRNLTPTRALDLACGVGRHAIFLAQHGWNVTAVDSSRVAIEILQQRAQEGGVKIDAHVANLELGDFHVESDAYDLICMFYYLQRDLFPAIRAGVKSGGSVVAAFHLNDGKTGAKARHTAFFLEPRVVRECFTDSS